MSGFPWLWVTHTQLLAQRCLLGQEGAGWLSPPPQAWRLLSLRPAGASTRLICSPENYGLQGSALGPTSSLFRE